MDTPFLNDNYINFPDIEPKTIIDFLSKHANLNLINLAQLLNISTHSMYDLYNGNIKPSAKNILNLQLLFLMFLNRKHKNINVQLKY